MLRHSILDHYDKLLSYFMDLSFFEAERNLSDLGNASGIYPDTALLYYFLIKEFNLKKVIEIGSGISTLFFAQSCKLLDANFISFEEKEQYKKITHNLLARYSFPSTLVLDYALFDDDLLKDCDLIFLDGSVKARQDFLLDNKCKDIPIVAVDDFEVLSTECFSFMEINNRPFFYVHNGSGRGSRLQFLNHTFKVDFLTKIHGIPELFIQ